MPIEVRHVLLDIRMLALDVVVVGMSYVPCPLAISILKLEASSVGKTFPLARGNWEGSGVFNFLMSQSPRPNGLFAVSYGNHAWVTIVIVILLLQTALP